MSVAVAAPSTNWKKKEGWYEGRKCGTIRGAATLIAGTQFYTIPIPLPPRCKPVWAAVVNQTAVSVVGGVTTDATNAANSIALAMYPAAATATVALTTPATGSSTSHTNLLLLCPSLASAATPSNAVGTVGHIRGSPLGVRLATNVLMENPRNLNALLVLRPALAVSNAVVFASAATNTNSNMVFGTATNSATSTSLTAGTVQVTVYYEEFLDPQSTWAA